jgi:Flp pilus assembly pilin Flp
MQYYIAARLSELKAREEGQTIIEYALVLLLVVVVLAGALAVTDLETAIGDAIDDVVNLF